MEPHVAFKFFEVLRATTLSYPLSDTGLELIKAIDHYYTIVSVLHAARRTLLTIFRREFNLNRLKVRVCGRVLIRETKTRRIE
jgi:AraC-like DNA-binding protein